MSNSQGQPSTLSEGTNSGRYHTSNSNPGPHRVPGDDKRYAKTSDEAWYNSSLLGISLPAWTGAAVKGCLAATVALYILNQKHLLPKPLSAVVSKALFWPTLPITVSKRMGKWSTVVDDTVLIGGAPFGFAKYPERLYHEFGVRGVVNLCREYQGPERSYRRLGMKHLWLPTTDHFEPSVTDLERAVSFIKEYQQRGEKVYVHCRAGHGRSAAVVFAWLLYKDPSADLKELNQEFCQLRDVRKTLWKQTNIKEFYARLRSRKHIEMTEMAVCDDEYDHKNL